MISFVLDVVLVLLRVECIFWPSKVALTVNHQHHNQLTSLPPPSSLPHSFQIDTTYEMKFMKKPLAAFIGLSACVSALPASPVPQLQNELQSRATSFWYANMDHTGSARGYAPDLDGDYTYPVYKAVNAGDADALQAAINDDGISGNQRNSEWLASEPRV